MVYNTFFRISSKKKIIHRDAKVGYAYNYLAERRVCLEETEIFSENCSQLLIDFNTKVVEKETSYTRIIMEIAQIRTFHPENQSYSNVSLLQFMRSVDESDIIPPQEPADDARSGPQTSSLAELSDVRTRQLMLSYDIRLNYSEQVDSVQSLGNYTPAANNIAFGLLYQYLPNILQEYYLGQKKHLFFNEEDYSGIIVANYSHELKKGLDYLNKSYSLSNYVQKSRALEGVDRLEVKEESLFDKNGTF